MEERVRQVELRVVENSTRLAAVEKDVDGLGIKVNRMGDELKSEIRSGLKEVRAEYADEMKWIRRGLVGTALSFLMMTAAFVALILGNAPN